MEVPLWEDLPAYLRNSAVFNVQNMTTPLLIEVGDADGTVFCHQGFGHYLKDEPAAGWITDGQSCLERQQEVKRLKSGH